MRSAKPACSPAGSRMLVPVLLSWFWMLVRGQSSDPYSWTDQAATTSDGLCRYGDAVGCCWGWRRTSWGQCQPDCQQGCKHGDCVEPDRCKCHQGYAGKACNQDLNECGVKPRPCKHRCVNTAGSYKCFCADGFALQPDGSCRNVRTCYHANCQYGCEVMKGEVRCTCPSPGLRLGPDRRSCVDVDECALGGGMCPRRRKCFNTFGSFFCKCHLGFQLMYINGRYACIDKDTRPFCSLNPSSPKCGCKDGSCKAIPKVTLEPHRPRTTTPISPLTTASTPTPRPTTTTNTPAAASSSGSSTFPPTTTPTTTAVIATSSKAPSTVAVTTRSPTAAPATTITPPRATFPSTAAQTTPTVTQTPPTTTETTPTIAVTTPTTTQTTPIIAETTPTTVATTVAPTTDSLVTTTLNNRINKDVTQRQRGDVHIPRVPGHNHVWEFDIELGNAAEDARDDPEIAELHCSFNRGLCDWISDREGDLDWDVVDSPAGGRYLSVPVLKAGKRSIRGARLAVQILRLWNQGDACFSFSHWMTGHHVGVLQLFVRRTSDKRYGSALWSRTGGHGWRKTQVTLESHSVDNVLLKAERRNGRRGQIAVDDVILRRGACR